MKKIYSFIIAIMTYIIFCHNISYAKDFEIVALVNNKPILLSEVKDRINISIAASKMPNSLELQKDLYPTILQLIIDEILYKMAADKLNIKVTNDELEASFREVEKRNNIKQGEIRSFIAKSGVRWESFKNQVKSELLKKKVMADYIKKNINIAEAEVEEYLDNLSKTSFEEVSLSEIIINKAKFKDAAEAKEYADNLVKQIKSGRSLNDIKDEKIAVNNLGWIKISALNSSTADSIENLRPGELSAIINDSDNYKIIKLNDIRIETVPLKITDEILIKQALIPAARKPEEFKNTIEKHYAQIKGCENFADFAKNIKSSLPSDSIMVSRKSLSPELYDVLKNTEVNRPTPIITTPAGIYVFIRCPLDKALVESQIKTRARNELWTQKQDIAVKALINNLRKKAYIEIRKENL